MGDNNSENFNYFLIGDSCDGGDTELYYGSDCVEGDCIEPKDIDKFFPYGYLEVPLGGYVPSPANYWTLTADRAYAAPGSLVKMFVAKPNKKLRGAINQGATLFASGEGSKFKSIWGPAVAVFTKDGSFFE